jgi:hypothetical protein
MTTRKLTRTGLAFLCTAATALATQSTSASASVGHKYLSQITEVPAGPGVTASGPFGTLEGAGFASDSGNVYIADPGKGVLDEFNSSGGLVTQFPSLEGGGTLAVRHATGEVYAGNYVGTVSVYSPAGVLLNSWLPEGVLSPSNFFDGASVSIDNSPSGIAAGDAYVGGETAVEGRQTGVVALIKPEAGGNGTRLRLLSGPIGAPEVFRTVVDEATGDLVVLDGGRFPVQRTTLELFKPTAAGEYEFVSKITGPPGGQFQRITGAATDPSNGEIYVAEATAGAVYQFDSSGAYIGQILNTPAGVFVPDEVTVSSTGDVYISDLNTDTVDVFGPDVAVPFVSTDAASNVNGRKATLDGTVNPVGASIATCKFEYGTTSSYGSVVPCSSLPGSGSSPVAVSANLTGLTPNTTYYYKLSVTDGEGTLFLGFGKTLATRIPEATLPGPTNGLSTSVTINAVVEPHETAVETCEFEYGPEETYSSTVPCTGAPGASAVPVPVSANLTGLAIDSVYHYRLVITVNGGETVHSNGAGELFATTPVVNGSAPVTNITSFAATVTGMFLAAELAPTYHFAYGTTTAYGSVAPAADAKGSPNLQQAVSQTLTGLQPDTTYHYALVTTNLGGAEDAGPDETFTTRPLVPPGVVTGVAGELTGASAALNGAVNAEGLPTTYRFEYGTSTAYGSTWPSVQVYAGTGDTSQSVTVAVPNLQSSTTYHYRLVATNEDGTTNGSDLTFTTPGYPVSIVQEAPTLNAQFGFFNPEAPVSSKSTIKTLTNAQKLAAALKVCKKQAKGKRTSCEKAAQKKFGPVKKRGKKK